MMKQLAITLLVLVAITGCKSHDPLVIGTQADTIRSYRSGIESVITDQKTLDKLMSFFTDKKRTWRIYWVTTRSPEVMIVLEREGMQITRVLLDPDGMIVEISETDPHMHSTNITKEEYDESNNPDLPGNPVL